jgi:hypothetical protein
MLVEDGPFLLDGYIFQSTISNGVLPDLWVYLPDVVWIHSSDTSDSSNSFNSIETRGIVRAIFTMPPHYARLGCVAPLGTHFLIPNPQSIIVDT